MSKTLGLNKLKAVNQIIIKLVFILKQMKIKKLF